MKIHLNSMKTFNHFFFIYVYMPLGYAKTREDLPDYVDSQCAICLDNVDPNGITRNGVPNCVVCVNGHRMHRECYDSWGSHECPTCKVKEIDGNIRNCYTKMTGYGYGQRRGGRRRNKTHKKRKTNKKKKTKTSRRKM